MGGSVITKGKKAAVKAVKNLGISNIQSALKLYLEGHTKPR